MPLRCVVLLVCGGLLGCEATTGPGDEELGLGPLLQEGLVSSDAVKTVLTQDGTLYSWGDGRSGTLGQGDLKSHSSPKKVPGLERVIHYAQNGGMAFALTEDGSLYQWGHYMFSSIYPHPTTIPTKAGRVVGGVSVHAERWMLFIVDQHGALWRVDPSHVHPSKNPVAQRVSRPKGVRQVSGGVGLYQDGSLFNLENLGPSDGGPVTGFNGIVAVHNSFENTVALKADGTVWAWGHDLDCGLGDGAHMESEVPMRIPGLTGVEKISGRGEFRFAVLDDGTVWYWGYRGWNEDHSPICQMVPIQVPGITDAVNVSAHWETLIQTANGDLYVFEPKSLKVTRIPFLGG